MIAFYEGLHHCDVVYRSPTCIYYYHDRMAKYAVSSVLCIQPGDSVSGYHGDIFRASFRRLVVRYLPLTP